MALFRKLVPEAIIPTRATAKSAGYDLHCIEDFILPEVLNCDEPVKIGTGIAIQIPDGYCGQIWCKSGLGSKGLVVHGGLVDGDYQGEIFVLLSNHGYGSRHFKCGEAIAQIVFVPCYMEGDVDTVRVGGFGSTDVKPCSMTVQAH
jgi:dUTP pyrophosphatase